MPAELICCLCPLPLPFCLARGPAELPSRDPRAGPLHTRVTSCGAFVSQLWRMRVTSCGTFVQQAVAHSCIKCSHIPATAVASWLAVLHKGPPWNQLSLLRCHMSARAEFLVSTSHRPCSAAVLLPTACTLDLGPSAGRLQRRLQQSPGVLCVDLTYCYNTHDCV